MNKKVMALAIAGAFAVPAVALADASIYGRVNVGFDNYEATGSTAGSGADLKSRNRVFDSASRLGFRASEDLGGGLRAVMVLESGVNFDTGTVNGQNNQPNVSSGVFASRDSYGGLEGDWGRVSFGRQSVFWTNGVIAQSGANYVNVDVPMATMGGGFGRVGGIGTRINNTMMYTAPNVNGFSGYVSYSPQSEAASGGQSTDAVVEGLRVTYTGRVNVQADWATNKTQSGLSAHRLQTTGTKLGVGFPYAPGAQISLIVGNNENKDVSGTTGFSVAGDTVKQTAIVLNWEQIFGNIQVMAMAGKLQKATGCTETATTTCDNTEATSLMVGAKYLFSKKTGAYVTYNKTTNKDNQNIDYTAAGLTSANPLPVGADPRILAVGVIQNF
jgi:general bacterial porin, GBP family